MPNESVPNHTTPAFKPLLISVLALGVGAGGISTILGFFGQFDWKFDLLSHFREQYVVLFLILTLVTLFLKSYRLVAASFFFLFINASLFLPFYLPPKQPVSVGGLLIMSANVRRDTSDYQAIITYTQQTKPDIIVLTEMNERWFTQLSPLQKTYPYVLKEVREDYSGIVMFSKLPLTNTRVLHSGYERIPSLVADVTQGKATLTILGIHPLPPFGKRNARIRDEAFQQLGQYITELKIPMILVGDFNATPFSYPYRRLLQETGLRNCADGYGYQPTWQYSRFMPPLGLKIDNCLASPGITVYDNYAGAKNGSDHLPLMTRISF